jgi:hypothetical protein
MLEVAFVPINNRSPAAPPAAVAAVLPPSPLSVIVRLLAVPVLIVIADELF